MTHVTPETSHLVVNPAAAGLVRIAINLAFWLVRMARNIGLFKDTTES